MNRELIILKENTNKTPALLCKYEDKVFAGQRFDRYWKIESKIFQNCTFSKMGFLEAKFKNTDVRYCTFIDCYFRKAEFNAVDFTGVVFINCTFDLATFINCIFDYVNFKDCYIKFEIMKENLPRTRHNLNRDLCRNLSIECLKMGDDQNYRKYYFEEKCASERYNWKKFYHKAADNADNLKSYEDKYTMWDQLEGLLTFVLAKLDKHIWGYGEKLSRLFRNILIIIIFFSGIYWLLSGLTIEGAMKWYEYLYISLCNFFSIGLENTDASAMGEILKAEQYKYIAVAETGLGVISMGFFVAALFKYINRRG